MADVAPADRLWWPSNFIEDEFHPAGRANASDWLHRLDDGAHQVRDKDEPEERSFLVTEGQVVDFTFCDSFQRKPFEIAADGKITFPNGAPTGNHFWLEDEPEACGDTLAELLDSMDDMDVSEGGNIRSCTWKNVEQPHRFTAQGGPPRFEPVAA